MTLQEQHFANLSRYPKRSATSIPAHEVDSVYYVRAEDKPNGGIIQSVVDTRHLKRGGLSKSEHQALVKRARRDHKIALANVKNQDAENTKAIGEQIAKFRREQKKVEAKTEMPSKRGRLFLSQLKDAGVYRVEDFKQSKVYLRKIVKQARKLGYQIKAIREGRTIVSYELVGNKKP